MNEHSATLHPAATDHLPFFITAPGQSDGLFSTMLVFLIIVVFLACSSDLRLHALPEHMAHGTSKVQMQIVGVLALLALFTHNHAFWIGVLLIAIIQFPDFSSPLGSMAQSLEKLAGSAPPPGAAMSIWPPRLRPSRRCPRSQCPRGWRRTRRWSARRSAWPDSMLEFLLCSSLTILPDFLFRRYVQG